MLSSLMCIITPSSHWGTLHNMDRQILVLSGDQAAVSDMGRSLAPLGCRIISKTSLTTVIRAMKGSELILVDLRKDGISALREIISYHPEAVVLVTADRECTGTAFDEGAYECLDKPLDPLKLRTAVRNAFRQMELRQELDRLRNLDWPEIIAGKNVSMLKALKQAEKAAAKDFHLLVWGEEGTGKELLAKSVHLRSHRRTRPFVTVAASPEGFEEECLGPPGAAGKLASAEGGTVFIDGVHRLGAEARQKLNSFLKDRGVSFRKDGEAVRVDARVICSATEVDRQEPFYHGFKSTISVPPLRKRTEDIVPLAEHFLGEAENNFAAGPKTLTRQARNFLRHHRWPGNVGELKSLVKKGYLLCRGPEVDRCHLAFGDSALYGSVKEFLEDRLKGYITQMSRLDNSDLHDTVMSEVEKALLELALRETSGNQIKTAKLLGINRTTLRTKIKAYRIENGAGPGRNSRRPR
jgi:DNA-binding NtrC family response regulator